MLEERRQYIRLSVEINFTYKVKGSKGPGKKGITQNLSPAGIMGIVDKGIKTSTWLELKLYMPRMKEPIPVIGKVLWTVQGKAGKIKAGVKFEKIDPEMKNKFLESICGLMFSELERLRL